MKPAFSTVACPDWTLDRIIPVAGELGYMGVEMRSFGADSRAAARSLACEPCLTGAEKIRELCDEHGVEPACIATSIRYDAPVFPPVIGRVIGDFERPVRDTKAAVQLASSIGCPAVRVFGFELGHESRSNGVRRIMQRLDLAARTARHTGVLLLIENGGSFPTSADLMELIDRLASPFVAAAYSPAVASMAGEDPREGVRTLGPLLASVKLRDMAGGKPAPLGEGEAGFGDGGAEGFVRMLAERGYKGWAVYEHDRLWWPELGDPTEPLRDAAEKIYRWMGTPRGEIEARKFAVA
jgi:sugar phosphate isomerase/epimerase